MRNRSVEVTDEQIEAAARYMRSLKGDQVYLVKRTYIGTARDEQEFLGLFSSWDRADQALRKLLQSRYPNSTIVDTTMTQGGVMERQLQSGFQTRDVYVSGDGLLFVSGAFRWTITACDLDGDL